MAEKQRFELWRPVKAYAISNRARSTNYATSPGRLIARMIVYHNSSGIVKSFSDFFDPSSIGGFVSDDHRLPVQSLIRRFYVGL